MKNFISIIPIFKLITFNWYTRVIINHPDFSHVKNVKNFLIKLLDLFMIIVINYSNFLKNRDFDIYKKINKQSTPNWVNIVIEIENFGKDN